MLRQSWAADKAERGSFCHSRLKIESKPKIIKRESREAFNSNVVREVF